MNLEQEIIRSIKNPKRCNIKEYHIKKEYTKLIHRGLVIVEIINTREKKFLAHYIPENLMLEFNTYQEADLCATIMKSFYNKLNKRFN